MHIWMRITLVFVFTLINICSWNMLKINKTQIYSPWFTRGIGISQHHRSTPRLAGVQDLLKLGKAIPIHSPIHFSSFLNCRNSGSHVQSTRQSKAGLNLHAVKACQVASNEPLCPCAFSNFPHTPLESSTSRGKGSQHPLLGGMSYPPKKMSKRSIIPCEDESGWVSVKTHRKWRTRCIEIQHA